MRRHGSLCLLLAIAVIVPILLSAKKAAAIPAFARRYKLSCTTCHAPFPKLKPYGDDFAGDGFVIPEEERERDYISAGDDLLWLNRDFPFAMRFDAYMSLEANGDTRTDLRTPWGLKLMSGGALYKNISYYFYFYLSEHGEVAGVEDAYIHFNDLGGLPLDAMVGQFQTSDPLMKRELRLTFEDYQIYKQRIGQATANLAYDRGLMVTYGIDATATDLVAMVVNGNGIDESNAAGFYDDDAFKNVAGRVSQGLGEYGSVGGFVYYGKEEAANGVENEITYAGPDINLAAGPVELTAQYLYRQDTNAEFVTVVDPSAPDIEETETNGLIAELIIAPQGDQSRVHGVLLYNKIDCDIDAYDYESMTGSLSYLLARNLRLVAEYTRDLEFEENRVTFGFVSGF